MCVCMYVERRLWALPGHNLCSNFCGIAYTHTRDPLPRGTHTEKLLFSKFALSLCVCVCVCGQRVCVSLYRDLFI